MSNVFSKVTLMRFRVEKKQKDEPLIKYLVFLMVYIMVYSYLSDKPSGQQPTGRHEWDQLGDSVGSALLLLLFVVWTG